MIYFDNAATTKVNSEVAKVIYESLCTDFANPSSLYNIGAKTEKQVSDCRTNIASFINAKDDEIYFTSCATESNNILIYGLALARKNWANKIITTAYEHPSVTAPLENLKQMGFNIVQVLPNKDGNICIEDVIKEVDSKTALVVAIHVNNETGAVIDVQKLCSEVKSKNKRTVVHIDATQSFMKIPIDVKKINMDSMSFSGHKIGAPKGIGGFYLKKGTNIQKILVGGSQEKGLRSGTENIHYILGLNKACEILSKNIKENMNRYLCLKETLLQHLQKFDNVQVNSPVDAAPYIVNFSFLGYKSETVLHFLESNGIYISSSSACSKGSLSKTLSAMGVSSKHIDSSIRVSFGVDSTLQQIEQLVESLGQAKDKLQKVKK